MKRFTITQPTQDDCDELIAMHHQSWLDAYPNSEMGISREFINNHYMKRMMSGDGRAIRAGLIAESYENPNYYLRIARDVHGKIVGFVDARKDGTPELCALYVDKIAYGGGVAKELCSLALDWIGSKDETFVWLVDYNTRAQKFYEKFGFVIVDGSRTQYGKTPMYIVKMIRKASA